MSIIRNEENNNIYYNLNGETVLSAALEPDGGSCTVRISGAVKTMVAPCFSEIINEVLGKFSNIILDMSEVSYIASGGLRVLLNMQQQIDDDDNMEAKIINVPSNVNEVFETTGFRNILNIED
ncbi:MAG: STAS domain-containing protein [Oscillospiraceae bacterium]|nr:STAS domain-containing protein [Oscillospiraceae bacterium]